jgi:hypothetical protein
MRSSYLQGASYPICTLGPGRETCWQGRLVLVMRHHFLSVALGPCYRWPNESPGPSPIWPSPTQLGTTQARWTFVSGRVGPPGRGGGPGTTLTPLMSCWPDPRHAKARRPVKPIRPDGRSSPQPRPDGRSPATTAASPRRRDLGPAPTTLAAVDRGPRGRST